MKVMSNKENTNIIAIKIQNIDFTYKNTMEKTDISNARLVMKE